MSLARLVAAVMLVVLVGGRANADDGGGAEAGTGGYGVHGTNASAVSNPVSNQVDSETPLPPGSWVTQPVCQLGGEAVCVVPETCADGSTQEATYYLTEAGEALFPSTSCPGAAVAEPPAITSAMITRAFQRIPVPAPKLIIQPPNGETLVNFATNFYTEAEPFERSVRLVGQRVDLRIWPSSFAWDFGDGEQTTTSEPGAAYPDLRITHEYAAAGSVGPSVDITYSAEFRVNGGAWEPVVGTVTSEGDPVGLQVRTASPTLVGY